jgi:(2R)-3-sulfolactate dehydrogenase (NADP+)
MIGRAFGNSPSAMPAWGGTRALFGTNPIAAVFPRRDGPPLSIDMSLSEMARGKGGNPPRIPKPGSRLDAAGRRLKGAMLALVVDLLVTALTGAQMGFEASSFFVEEGDKPRIRDRWRAPRPTGRGSRPCSPLCCRTKMCACRAIAGTILPTGQSSRAWKFLN